MASWERVVEPYQLWAFRLGDQLISRQDHGARFADRFIDLGDTHIGLYTAYKTWVDAEESEMYRNLSATSLKLNDAQRFELVRVRVDFDAEAKLPPRFGRESKSDPSTSHKCSDNSGNHRQPEQSSSSNKNGSKSISRRATRIVSPNGNINGSTMDGIIQNKIASEPHTGLYGGTDMCQPDDLSNADSPGNRCDNTVSQRRGSSGKGKGIGKNRKPRTMVTPKRNQGGSVENNKPGGSDNYAAAGSDVVSTETVPLLHESHNYGHHCNVKNRSNLPTNYQSEWPENLPTTDDYLKQLERNSAAANHFLKIGQSQDDNGISADATENLVTHACEKLSGSSKRNILDNENTSVSKIDQSCDEDNNSNNFTSNDTNDESPILTQTDSDTTAEHIQPSKQSLKLHPNNCKNANKSLRRTHSDEKPIGNMDSISQLATKGLKGDKANDTCSPQNLITAVSETTSDSIELMVFKNESGVLSDSSNNGDNESYINTTANSLVNNNSAPQCSSPNLTTDKSCQDIKNNPKHRRKRAVKRAWAEKEPHGAFWALKTKSWLNLKYFITVHREFNDFIFPVEESSPAGNYTLYHPEMNLTDINSCSTPINQASETAENCGQCEILTDGTSTSTYASLPSVSQALPVVPPEQAFVLYTTREGDGLAIQSAWSGLFLSVTDNSINQRPRKRAVRANVPRPGPQAIFRPFKRAPERLRQLDDIYIPKWAYNELLLPLPPIEHVLRPIWPIDDRYELVTVNPVTDRTTIQLRVGVDPFGYNPSNPSENQLTLHQVQTYSRAAITLFSVQSLGLVTARYLPDRWNDENHSFLWSEQISTTPRRMLVYAPAVIVKRHLPFKPNHGRIEIRQATRRYGPYLFRADHAILRQFVDGQWRDWGCICCNQAQFDDNEE